MDIFSIWVGASIWTAFIFLVTGIWGLINRQEDEDSEDKNS